MKNLILLCILISLILLAYFYDDKQITQNDDGITREIGQQIFNFDLNKLTSLELPYSKVRLIEGQWIVTDKLYEADKSILNKVIERLNNIHVLRQLKVNPNELEDFFIDQNLFFKIETFEKSLEIRLGDVSESTGNFYMLVSRDGKQKLYLCHDTSFFEGFYRTEIEANLQRYLSLKNLVILKPLQLIDRKVFKDIDFEKVESIELKNTEQQFSLNLTKNKTFPTPIEGLPEMDLKKLLKEKMMSTRFIEIESLKTQLFDNELSSLKVFSNEETYDYVLYTLKDSEQGFFLVDEIKRKVFTLDSKNIGFMISNVDDFWSKRVMLPATSFKSNDTLKFFLGKSDKKLFPFEVYNLKNFTIRSLDKSISLIENNLFNTLFAMIFAQGEFNQAFTVEKIENLELIKKYEGIFFELLGRKFFVFKHKGKLFLIDRDNSLQFLYLEADNISDKVSVDRIYREKSK